MNLLISVFKKKQQLQSMRTYIVLASLLIHVYNENEGVSAWELELVDVLMLKIYRYAFKCDIELDHITYINIVQTFWKRLAYFIL